MSENDVILKPCPFCGGVAELGENFGRASVYCSSCGASFRSDSVCGGEDEVIKLWNTRK